uniref:Serine protease 12 [Nasonia vitripennis] n=1 Tax=Lepeophtheirus salmonis TaxID=72036 RepID=A0A0K2T3Q8_LEPSM
MVVAGEHDLSEKSGDEQTVGVQKIIMYELYGTKRNSYDICLLKLESPLKLNDKVKTITLPEKDEEFTGEAIVSGWGVRSFGSSTSPVLRATNITLISFDECKDKYGRQFDETMICAGSLGKDSCQGDSGGPLFQNGKLVGIVSWGVFCGHPSYPGVYGKVSKFHDWILAHN